MKAGTSARFTDLESTSTSCRTAILGRKRAYRAACVIGSHIAGQQDKVADIHPAFRRNRFGPDGICWLAPQQLCELEARYPRQVRPAPVLPVLPSMIDCHSNLWRKSVESRRRRSVPPCGLRRRIRHVTGFVALARGQQRPGEPRVFVGHRHGRDVVMSASGELIKPRSSAIRPCLCELNQSPATMDEQGSQVDVAPFADAKQLRPAAAGDLTRNQADPCRELPCVLEIARITSAGNQGARSESLANWGRPCISTDSALPRNWLSFCTKSPIIGSRSMSERCSGVMRNSASPGRWSGNPCLLLKMLPSGPLRVSKPTHDVATVR